MILILGPVIQNVRSKFLLVDFEADEDEKTNEGKYKDHVLNNIFFNF